MLPAELRRVSEHGVGRYAHGLWCLCVYARAAVCLVAGEMEGAVALDRLAWGERPACQLGIRGWAVLLSEGVLG